MTKLNEKEQELLNKVKAQCEAQGITEEEMLKLPVMYQKKKGLQGIGKADKAEEIKNLAAYQNKRLGIENYFVCTLGEYLAR